MTKRKADPLPRHLREPAGKDPHPRDGRYARRHPNSYYDDERSVEIVLTVLERAVRALERWRGQRTVSGPLPPAAAKDVKAAFEALSEITWHLPELNLWCVWTHYKDGWSNKHVVWSAHLTKEEAERWLPSWQKQLARRTDYGWHVGLHACRIEDVRDFGFKPEEIA